MSRQCDSVLPTDWQRDSISTETTGKVKLIHQFHQSAGLSVPPLFYQ